MEIASSRSKAYYQGLHAGNWFESKVWTNYTSKDECPFDKDSEDRNDWIRGWNDGRRLADRQYASWKSD